MASQTEIDSHRQIRLIMKPNRQSIIEEMARRWLRNPASLKVARRRKDGSPISFAWGKMRVRCKRIYERADELRPSTMSLNEAEKMRKVGQLFMEINSLAGGFWNVTGATAAGRDEITLHLKR